MAEEEKKKKKRRRTIAQRYYISDVRLKKSVNNIEKEGEDERWSRERRENGIEKIYHENKLSRRLRIASSHFLYILCIVPFILQYSSYVSAEGNVGCLYVGSLCLDGQEFCYDDLVFGKCLSKAGVEMEDIDRAPLTEEQSRMLGTMLEELQGAGLGWDHQFVQCRIQGTLFAMRRRTQLPPNLCANLAPNPEILGPQSPLAFVRFTPPENNEEYADEIYYPPLKKELDTNGYLRPMTPAQRHRAENMELLAELAHQPDILQEERQRIIQESLAKQELANRLKDMKNRLELQKMLSEYERGELKPPIFANNDIYLDPSELYDEQADEDFDDRIDAYKRSEQEVPATFFREISRNQHIPLTREHQLQSPTQEYYSHYKKSQPLVANVYNDELELSTNLYRPKEHQHRRPDQIGVYTEGGFFIPSERSSNEENRKEEARNLLANMLGFTRHERLDVKKPGPLIGPPPPIEKDNKTNSNNSSKKETKPENKEVLPTHIKTDSIKKAKKVIREHSSEDHAPYSVDTEYAFVIMKHPIDSWADGVRIVNALANTLQMNFTHPRVDSHEVSFRVEPNPEKKSAAEVAKSINMDRFKSNIYRRFGVTVVRAGVGNKVKDDSENEAVQASKMELSEEGPNVTHIMAYMFAGAGAAAAIVIVVVLFLIRRHDKKRDKLGGLQRGTTGSESCSKDYQELCRARMAAKGQSQDSPGGGRITALSKENERPPSSRSSTSSWSEEPALTNMDISTGHMVLSYMEDHLRNKGRLQREWEALCRYEAEPSARDAALQEECTALNRLNAPLPYDHSRVVLNHLANAEGLDYINASTITDHDPRAPAYVAAQGPLPTTLAHFWQMIWEQGAVVIVALCRLQENGEIACARYWPEEGAEVYHIYEVHLVSEHIWCDDYLVRSFYLKNLRTSETRTVTQFHFLSWPQSGVPPQAKALLEFRRKVNKSYRGRSCPIVVHGSNGAGRTGAYILLDLVLGRMNKGAREIDIAATLEHLRDQRAGLVATRQQFEFVLMAVAEEVHAILKALPANQSEKRDLDKDAVKEEDELNIKHEKQKPVDGKVDDTKESIAAAAPSTSSSSSTTTSKTTSTTTSSKKEEK